MKRSTRKNSIFPCVHAHCLEKVKTLFYENGRPVLKVCEAWYISSKVILARFSGPKELVSGLAE